MVLVAVLVLFKTNNSREQRFLDSSKNAWKINRKLRKFEARNLDNSITSIADLVRSKILDDEDSRFLAKHKARYYPPTEQTNDQSVRMEMQIMNKRILCFSDGSVALIHDSPGGYANISLQEFCEINKKRIQYHFEAAHQDR